MRALYTAMLIAITSTCQADTWVDHFASPGPVADRYEPGTTGLYCESPVRFDNYTVTGVVDPADPVKLPPPAVKTTLARFRADLTESYEYISTHGTIELFIRNSGKGPARLESIELNGKPVDCESQLSAVSWYEQRPLTVKPGETGVILVRMRGLPAELGKKICEDISARPLLDVKATWQGGITESFKIPLSGQVEPVQINYMAFSPDLKRMWVYLQNNDWIHYGKKNAKATKQIIVRGKDVTHQATFGEKKVAGEIGAILIAPRAVFRTPDGTGITWIDPDRTHDPACTDDGQYLVQLAVETALGRYRIDKERMVLTGFSQGGIIAISSGPRSPHRFAGVIPMGAGYLRRFDAPPETAGERPPRFYFMQGELERNHDQIRLAIADFKKAGFPTELRIYPNAGHRFPVERDEELRRALESVLQR